MLPIKERPAERAPLSPKRRPGRPSKISQDKTIERAQAIGGLFQLAGFTLMAKGQLADVAAIGMHSGPIAAETAKLAESNEQIAGILDKLTEIGPYAGLITAITPLVAQIMVNHERMQPGSLGTVPPKTLEAQMKAEMAQQKLEMLRMQKMAEDQAKEFEAAMQSENGKEPSQ